MRTPLAVVAAALGAALASGCAGAPKLGPQKAGIGVEASGSDLAQARRGAVAGLLDLFVSSQTLAAAPESLEAKVLSRAGDYLGRTKVLGGKGARLARIRTLVLTPKLGHDLEGLGLVRPEGVIGRPKVAVALREPGPAEETGRASDALRRALVSRGYLALDLGDKTLVGGTPPSDAASALAAARRLKAEVVVSGRGESAAGADPRLDGMPSVTARLSLEARSAGSGEAIGSWTEEASAVDLTPGGAQARALENAGEAAAERLAGLLAGRFREVREISLTVSGLGGLDEARRLLAALRALPRVAGAALEAAVGRDARLRVFVEGYPADELAATLVRLKPFRFAVRSVEPYYQAIELEVSGG